MISYLIDFVLMVALVVTALRCGRMYREIRSLRDNELATTIIDAEKALNRAAEAVVSLRHEGIETTRALESQIAEARRLSEELGALLQRADFHVAGGRTKASELPETYREALAATHDRLRASLAR